MTAFRRAVPIMLLLVLALAALPAAAGPLTQEGTHLEYDSEVRDQIGENEDADEWTFTGASGDLVLAEMVALDAGTLDTFLTLIDPEGNDLIEDDDSGEGYNARIGPYRLPVDGTYTLVAGHYSGGGDYMMVLQNLNTAPALSLDKPVIGTLDANHLTDYYLITPQADASEAMLRIQLRGGQDVTLSLYGPEGLVSSTESQWDDLGVIVAAPGETYVLVASWNFYGAGGPYELTLTTSELELLTDGAEQTGTLDSSTESQRHFFEAEEGDLIRVTLAADDSIAPAMAVTSLDDMMYLFDNDGTNTVEISVVLRVPATTIYTVDVRDSSYNWQTGSYRLRLEWIPVDSPQ